VQLGSSMVPHLGRGERVVAALPLATRIVRRLARLYALEERLIGAFHPQQHVVHDLGVDFGQLRVCSLQVGWLGLLLKGSGALALAAFPPDGAPLQSGVVERAAAR